MAQLNTNPQIYIPSVSNTLRTLLMSVSYISLRVTVTQQKSVASEENISLFIYLYLFLRNILSLYLFLTVHILHILCMWYSIQYHYQWPANIQSIGYLASPKIGSTSRPSTISTTAFTTNIRNRYEPGQKETSAYLYCFYG